MNEKFNTMDISSEKVLDNKIIGEHVDNRLKEMNVIIFKKI